MLIGPNPDEQREIIRLYVEGLTQDAVGRRVHWSRAAVRKVLARHDVPIRPRGTGPKPLRFTGPELERICELYRDGVSGVEIARRVGACHTTINLALRRAGVEIRPKRQACALARRQQLADNGRQILTGRQQLLLSMVEGRGPITTRNVARLSGVTVSEARETLMRLELLGLLHSTPTNQVGRMRRWRRSDLSTPHLLDRALNQQDGTKPAGPYLDIAPFTAFLEDLIEREERKARFQAVSREGADGDGGIPTIGVIATRMGLPERVIWRWRNEQRTIALTSADRALQAFDGGVTVYDLWPHLAVDDELEAAA